MWEFHVPPHLQLKRPSILQEFLVKLEEAVNSLFVIKFKMDGWGQMLAEVGFSF